MDDNGGRQSPNRPEDQEQLGRDDAVDDEITIGHAPEHLRARQGNEQGIPAKLRHSIACRGSGLDSSDDTASAEQDETAQDDYRPMAPIDPACQHHEAYRRNSDDGDHRSNCAHQRALKPADRRYEDSGSGWIGVDVLGNGWSGFQAKKNSGQNGADAPITK